MKKLILLLFTITCIINIGCYGEDPLIKMTSSGLLQGVEDEADTWSWRAIPYAKAPVGDLRWKAPQKPDPWTETRDASEFSEICPQYNASMEMVGNEDCLYLNVYRPRTDEKNLPVYFWIHGGGNTIQSPLNSDAKGANLASKSNMIVVSINYRLGPLGWFTHPALRNGNSRDNSGNYGTLDIIHALKWVKSNIAFFGGSPFNVTIAGESAGAFNILTLLTSNEAIGLFHKAIVESGYPGMDTVEDGDAHANSVMISLLINDGTCADQAEAEQYLLEKPASEIEAYLRSKTSNEILACEIPGVGGMYFVPDGLQDGVVLPEAGFGVFATGEYPNKVPLIIGTNKYEGKLFLLSNPAFASFFNGTVTPDVIELYGLASKYGSNLWKVAGVDNIANLVTAHQTGVYAYQFNWGAGDYWGGSVVTEPGGYLLGACHGAEIDFFLGNGRDALPLPMYTEENRAGREALSAAIMDYAATFARTGNPNRAGSELPAWAPWGITETNPPARMLFDADYTDLQIEMSIGTFSFQDVMAEMQVEPRYQEIMAHMGLFLVLAGLY